MDISLYRREPIRAITQPRTPAHDLDPDQALSNVRGRRKGIRIRIKIVKGQFMIRFCIAGAFPYDERVLEHGGRRFTSR
jgi:hypothetical protein